MINGTRVRHARELLGITQTELASAVEVSQPAIAQIEAGSTVPTETTIEKIALKTGFPMSFFKEDVGQELPMGSLLYRSHAATSTKEKTKSYRVAQSIFEFIERRAPELEAIPVRLPRLAVDPVTAAHICRSALGLAPDVPIPNLVNSIERAGVLVLGLPVETDKIDAFSVWAGTNANQPVIGAIANRPADRLRFSVAHELGHLVMHYPIRVRLEAAEHEAHSFASELLMPEAAMRDEITRPVTLSSLASLKPRWRVSIQALIRRAFDLNIITERQYRYLFEQLSARGMRKDEGVAIAQERPRGFRKMVEVLYGSEVSMPFLAEEMRLPVSLVRKIFNAYSTAQDLSRKSKPRLIRFEADRIQ